jgi:hypothetical protein
MLVLGDVGQNDWLNMFSKLPSGNLSSYGKSPFLRGKSSTDGPVSS